MKEPETLEEAHKLISSLRDELRRMHEQQQDWINLAREYIDDNRKNWAKAMIFRSKESERSVERSGDASRRPSD